MNRNSEHIKASVRKHYGAFGDEAIINPISKLDINIVNEFVEIFKKIKMNKLVAIMNNYKLDTDEKILEDLMEFNTNLKIGDNGVEEIDDLPYWIHFNDMYKNRILRVDLRSFSVNDGVGKGNKFFGILLNETPTDVKQVPMHANKVLIYRNEELRKKDMLQLESLINY